ncbi:MAG: metallophosphoesterase [Gaiellaceae bacterium]
MRGVIAAVALAFAVAVSGSAGAATRILAVGDFGVGGPTERALGASMKAWEAGHPANLLVTLGDNDYTESPAAFRRNWNDAFAWRAAAGLGVAGSLGNHDVRVQGGRYEFETLAMPGPYYVRSFPELDLFVLNSNAVGTRQTNWLRNHLSASTATWKVVVFHHPAYTCGGYLSNPAVVSRWVPLFRQYGVALVLAGHDHNYQRFAPRNGVTYVVHGGGGAHLYDLRSCPTSYPKRVFAREAHGFMYLVAKAGSLRGAAVNRAGRAIDRFVIYP